MGEGAWDEAAWDEAASGAHGMRGGMGVHARPPLMGLSAPALLLLSCPVCPCGCGLLAPLALWIRPPPLA